MNRGIFPESAADGDGTPAKWEQPGADEVMKALDKAGLGDTPAPEEKPAEEKSAPAPEAEKEEEPAKAEEPEKPAEEKPKTEEEGPEPAVEVKADGMVTIDGVEYTLQEVKAFRRGYMMQADYTKKTQALSDDRKALERERQEWQQTRQQAAEAAETAIPGESGRRTLAQQVTRIRELLADPEIPESTREALEIQQELTLGVLQTLHHRDVQARQSAEETAQRQHDARALQTFDTTFNTLCEKHKVTDPIDREFLNARIRAEDPDTADLDDFKSSVEKLFEHAHKGLQQRIEKAKREGVKTLEKLPVAPASKAGGGSAIPLKPETRAPQTLDDGSAIAEFQERLARLQGVS